MVTAATRIGNAQAQPLIITTPAGAQRELYDYELDLAYGQSENNFVLQTMSDIPPGSHIAMYNSEVGGIIDEVGTDTTVGYTEYRGRTWRGMLDGYIVLPPSGQTHYVMTGPLNTSLPALFAACGASDVFTNIVAPSDITYKFVVDRYVSLWDALGKLTTQTGTTFDIRADGLTCSITFRRVNTVGVNPYTVDVSASVNYSPVTHLVCLGSGEMLDRLVTELWWRNGAVTTTGSLTVNDVSDVYELSDCDNLTDLVRKGSAKLAALQTTDTAEVNYLGSAQGLGIGDTITVQDDERHLRIAAVITKIITKVSNMTQTTSVECTPTRAPSSSLTI